MFCVATVVYRGGTNAFYTSADDTVYRSVMNHK